MEFITHKSIVNFSMFWFYISVSSNRYKKLEEHHVRKYTENNNKQW